MSCCFQRVDGAPPSNGTASLNPTDYEWYVIHSVTTLGGPEEFIRNHNSAGTGIPITSSSGYFAAPETGSVTFVTTLWHGPSGVAAGLIMRLYLAGVLQDSDTQSIANNTNTTWTLGPLSVTAGDLLQFSLESTDAGSVQDENGAIRLVYA